MAIVRKLEPLTLEFDTKHTEVNCTYSIVEGASGEKYLQIDTYGSKKGRSLVIKASQYALVLKPSNN